MKILTTLLKIFSLLTGVLTLLMTKLAHPMTLVNHTHIDNCVNLIEYNSEYSDFVEEADFQEKGDEWLPLGSKYQEHVACFVR